MSFNIDKILEDLYSLQRLGIKVGLEHTIQLLEEIGRVRSIEIDNFGDIYIGVENLGIVKLTK